MTGDINRKTRKGYEIKFIILFVLLFFPMLALIPGIPFLLNPNDYTGLGQVFFGVPLTAIGSASFWLMWWLLYKKIHAKPFTKHIIISCIVLFLVLAVGSSFYVFLNS